MFCVKLPQIGHNCPEDQVHHASFSVARFAFHTLTSLSHTQMLVELLFDELLSVCRV